MIPAPLRLLAPPAIALGVIFLCCACSSGNRTTGPTATSVASSLTATAAARRAAPASQAASPGGSGSDAVCGYEQQLNAATLPFALAALGAGDEALSTPGPSTAADLTRNLAALESATQTFLSSLAAITPPPALQQYHSRLLAGYTAVEPLIARALTQATAGDIAGAQQSVGVASAQVQAVGDSLQQDFATLSGELDACPR